MNKFWKESGWGKKSVFLIIIFELCFFFLACLLDFSFLSRYSPLAELIRFLGYT